MLDWRFKPLGRMENGKFVVYYELPRNPERRMFLVNGNWYYCYRDRYMRYHNRVDKSFSKVGWRKGEKWCGSYRDKW